jgi:hypothetical protein
LQAPRDLFLAADDVVTRNLCLRIMQTACSGNISTTLHCIASSAALTPELFRMKSATAVRAVLAALRVGMNELSFEAIDFNVAMFKEFQFEAHDLRAAGVSLADMQAAGFSVKELKTAGYDVVYDFEPKELCAILRSSNRDMRTVICNAVKELCQKICGGSISAKACLQESLCNGLLLLLFTCAAHACKVVDAKMEVGDDGISEPAEPIKYAQSICEAIRAVSSFTIFDEDTHWPMPDSTKLCRLASAACSLWRNCHFGNLDRKRIFVAPIMDMASTLTEAMIFFETHPRNAVAMAWENRQEIYQIELSDKEFIRSLLMVCSAKPRTRYAFTASRVIRNGTNVTEFCRRSIVQLFNCSMIIFVFYFISNLYRSFGDSGVEGVRHVLNCISSTSHSTDALGNMLVTISNFASENIECAELVVKNRALEFLQPIVVHDDLLIALSACSGICTLAAEKKFFELVDRSDALICVVNKLRSITPGTLRAVSQWSTVDIKSLAVMMNADAHPAVQLCALHMIGRSFHLEQNQAMFSTVDMVKLFKNLAVSPDPFVYAAVVYLMRVIHIPVPDYCASRVGSAFDKSSIPVSDWSVDMVCQWVSAWYLDFVYS